MFIIINISKSHYKHLKTPGGLAGQFSMGLGGGRGGKDF